MTLLLESIDIVESSSTGIEGLSMRKHYPVPASGRTSTERPQAPVSSGILFRYCGLESCKRT